MSETKWVMSPDEIPEGAVKKDNSRPSLLIKELDGIVYYCIPNMQFNPDEIPVEMGGNKRAVL